MRSTDITVFYSTLRTGALERILKEQGKSLDSAVEEMLDDLYQRIVPEQERTEIEARIRQEEAQTAAETEAARRFAVYRIRELGEDSYFTSEAHNDLYLAACECRAYLQDPKPFLLPDYFSHKQICNQFRYSQLVNDLGYNPQITMVVELDADKGMCMVQKAGEDDSWHQYRMKDLSTGIFRAKRKREYAGRTRQLPIYAARQRRSGFPSVLRFRIFVTNCMQESGNALVFQGVSALRKVLKQN